MKRFLVLCLLATTGWAAADELSLQDAIRLAVSRNPSLQATQQDVAIAQAQAVQAGLSQNPQLGATLRFPNQPGFQNSSDFSVTFDLLDLSRRPLRERIAGVQVHQAEARGAEAVAGLRAEVCQAWYDLSAAQEAVKLEETIMLASQGACELSKHQFEAGTESELDYQRQKAATAQDKLDLARTRQDVRLAQQRLQRFLGGTGPVEVGALPAVPAADPDETALEQAAVAHRGVVVEARLQADVLQGSLALERLDGGWGQLRAGVDGGQEVEGVTVIGPTLQLSVPIFDRNQGAIQKVEQQLKQGQQRLAAVERQVRLEVQEAYGQMQGAREQVALYENDLLPARATVLQQAQLHYDNMQLSVYQLLADRQAEAEAQRQHIDAQRDYWKAAAALDRAVGVQP